MMSKIQEFYENKTVFITGSTGFLGKVILEKILRSCRVKKVYILVRVKKGLNEDSRFKAIFDVPMFEVLRKEKPDFMDSICLMCGDIQEECLGLSKNDQNTLINETNVIIHCAATVRFDQSIKKAAHINVRCVIDLINMANKMKDLQAMVHVSTAYTFPNRTNIDEHFYEPAMSATKLLTLVDGTDEEKLDNITEELIVPWPNTYVYTKAIAEDAIKRMGKTLPIAIIRPAMIVASANEPIKGWIDNMYGPTGIVACVATGLLHSMNCVPENISELVPVDYTANCILAASWELTIRKNKHEVPIYNYVSSPESPQTWAHFTVLALKYGNQIPFNQAVYLMTFQITKHAWLHNIKVLFFHIIPAYTVDFVCRCCNIQPRMVAGYAKIHKFLRVLSLFVVKQFYFTNSNTRKLWGQLNAADQQIFAFSMDKFDWDAYFKNYMHGTRVYLLKDPIETVPAALRKQTMLKAAHYSLMFIILFVGYLLLNFLFNTIFN